MPNLFKFCLYLSVQETKQHGKDEPLKRVKEQFGKKQNKKSHGFLVYIVEGCHHVVQREDDVIYAKQWDQDEDRFSQASAKPRKRER